MASDPHKLRFGGDCEGFLYLPRSESPAGAVVILHERYGLVQHTLDLAQRLARDGYAALAPNLFSRWRGDEAALRAGRARVVLPDPEVAAVIDAALDFLKGHPRVAPERIALMGVCQSGRYPIVIGSRRRDLAAFVVLYGGSQQRDWQVSDLQPEPMQEMMRSLSAPVLFVYGERDHTISLADVRRTRDALEEGRCSYRMKVFPGMPHGWLNDTMPGRYRAKEADEAWGMPRVSRRCFRGQVAEQGTGALGVRERKLSGLRLLEEPEAGMNPADAIERLDPGRTARVRTTAEQVLRMLAGRLPPGGPAGLPLASFRSSSGLVISMQVGLTHF